MADGQSVLAIVLTYNAPDSLVGCLHAVEAQTRLPDSVLVIDNASTPPAVEAVRAARFDAERVVVRRQPVNGGPAGGHAAGLREFVASGYNVAWVMDDDCVPEPDCLEQLLRKGVRRGGPIYVFPRWVQPDGSVTAYPAWCGFVISRQIVEEVGLPLEELFWWAEDTEYLFWRIPRAGYPFIHASAAAVHHTQVRARHGNPPWKYYYEARNDVFFHVHVKHSLRRLPRKLSLLLARAVFRERSRRISRLAMIARGVRDGVFRRLGKRVDVDPAWAA